MTQICDEALGKLDNELRHFSGGQHAKAVYRDVAKTLKQFCEKSDDFARAVAETPKTLSDCVAAVVKGVGNCLSDIDAYRKAARFYFPDAAVAFHMNITTNGNEHQETSNRAGDRKVLRLLDLI